MNVAQVEQMLLCEDFDLQMKGVDVVEALTCDRTLKSNLILRVLIAPEASHVVKGILVSKIDAIDTAAARLAAELVCHGPLNHYLFMVLNRTGCPADSVSFSDDESRPRPVRLPSIRLFFRLGRIRAVTAALVAV